jgi:CRP/FNR family cyclic AMP-dependent transcriptional regulator
MIEPVPSQSLLGIDPDLGQLLASERATAAARDLRARVTTLDIGPWYPAELGCASALDVGLLIVRGVIARELWVHDAPSAELFGPGDIIRFRRLEAPPQAMLHTTARWTALGKAAVAVPDRNTRIALRNYPEVAAILVDRLNARAERLAVTQAISQITGVEMRVEALLWHLAERWGRVGTNGIIIPVALSHRMIGSLVGARRPTVSTAIARLTEEGRLTRRPDGSWLLMSSEPPCAAGPMTDPFSPAMTKRIGIERPVSPRIAA